MKNLVYWDKDREITYQLLLWVKQIQSGECWFNSLPIISRNKHWDLKVNKIHFLSISWHDFIPNSFTSPYYLNDMKGWGIVGQSITPCVHGSFLFTLFLSLSTGSLPLEAVLHKLLQSFPKAAVLQELLQNGSIQRGPSFRNGILLQATTLAR